MNTSSKRQVNRDGADFHTTSARPARAQTTQSKSKSEDTDVLRLIPDAAKDRLAGVLICERHSESDRKVAKELRADLRTRTEIARTARATWRC